MTFKATYDNVVVKLLEKENTSLGGIVLAGNPDKTHNRGVVTYVGEGRKNKAGAIIPLTVNVGDIVLFPLTAGIKVVVNGENCIVVKEDIIFATEA